MNITLYFFRLDCNRNTCDDSEYMCYNGQCCQGAKCCGNVPSQLMYCKKGQYMCNNLECVNNQTDCEPKGGMKYENNMCRNLFNFEKMQYFLILFFV